jgi:hypothetical protein
MQASMSTDGYRTQASDTTLEAERVLIERYRAMSPADKLSIVRALCRATDELALVGARLRHPGASARELRLHAASTRLPAEAMRAAFGWSPGDR